MGFDIFKLDSRVSYVGAGLQYLRGPGRVASRDATRSTTFAGDVAAGQGEGGTLGEGVTPIPLYSASLCLAATSPLNLVLLVASVVVRKVIIGN